MKPLSTHLTSWNMIKKEKLRCIKCKNKASAFLCSLPYCREHYRKEKLKLKQKRTEEKKRKNVNRKRY